MDKEYKSQPQTPFRLNTLKLAPPVAANRAIERENLCSMICASQATVTLLCAPAGFGKTTSMSQAFRTLKEQGVPVAWITIDPADNDIGRLSMYLVAALRGVLDELSLDPSALGETRGDFGTGNALAYKLVEALPLIGKDFRLFIDEFEHLNDPEVMSFMDRLLSILDPGQRLVIGSRRSTNLHLGRLRVQGLSLELGVDALRFSESETERFVRERLHAPLDEAELHDLHGRTEGWAAALQLATTAALLGKRGPSMLPAQLSGSIADYLAEDVLGRLPQEHRDFLLRSSIFESFCPQMYDEVFGGDDCARWIQRTTAANLFLHRIDADGDWHRYHPLFLDFLRKECAQVFKTQLRDFHARAAAWLGQSGRTSLAIDHALLAQDHRLAADLVEQCAMRYVRTGQLKAVCQWIDLLPAHEVQARPELMIAGAYACTYLHRYPEASAFVARLDAMPPSSAELADDLLLIKSLLAVWTDAIVTAFKLGLEHQSHLQGTDPYVIGVINNVVAYNHTFQGNYFLAHQSLATAKRALSSVNALHGLTYSAWLECSLCLLQGDAKETLARAQTSLDQVVNAGHKYSSASPVAAATLIEVLYEINDFERLEPLLDDYLTLIRETCIPDHAITAHRVAARMYVLKEQLPRALEVLNILQDLGDARSIPRFAAAARLDRLWIASVAGDLATVHRLLPLVKAESIWKPFEGYWTHAEDIDGPMIAEFREALLAGDVTTTIPRLESAIRQAEAVNRRRRVFRLQCLLAQAHELARRRQRALDILERTLIAAHPLGLIRVFADESWCLVPLLEALALRESPIPQRYLDRLIAAARIRSIKTTDNQGAQSLQQESPLSPRERQILSLLSEGYSNKELASRALVAESTVETYLHRINTKLGTRNRTQAVARARDLKLI